MDEALLRGEPFGKVHSGFEGIFAVAAIEVELVFVWKTWLVIGGVEQALNIYSQRL